MSIYVSGSLAFDRIMTFPGKFSDHILPEKIHILNVSFMIESLEEWRGGTAGNIAYSLALLEEKPLILGSVGKDFAPYEAVMTKLGLSADGLKKCADQFTAGAYITTDQNNNQITGFNPGAMKMPCGYAFPHADPVNDLAIISPGNVDDMCTLPSTLRELGIRYIFDPGQQIPVLPADKLLNAVNGAYILVTNDYELAMIMKNTGTTKAELLEMCPIIITTLSEKGSRVEMAGSPSSLTEIPAVTPAGVADPTGAGDAYRAGLIKGLVAGLSVAEAARLGATCASYCVEQKGTQEHSFTLAEFRQRHAKAFGSCPL